MSKKKSKLRIASALLAFAMVAPVIPQMAPVTSYAEVEPANWVDDEETARYWPIPHQGRLVKVASAEPLKNPSLRYIGVYTRPDGREVLRLAMGGYSSAISGVWLRMLIKPDDNLYKLIDWTQSGMAVKRPEQFPNNHDGYNFNKDFRKFDNVSSTQVGSGNVKSMDLSNSGTMTVTTGLLGVNFEVPIDLVLKDGETLKNLDKNPLVQMRLMDDKYERIYSTTIEDNQEVPYSSYTMSTFVPVRVDLKQGILNTDVVRNEENIFQSASSYIKYNEEKGYVDVYTRRTQGLVGSTAKSGGAYGFMQTFDKSFIDILKPQDESGTVAQIFAANDKDAVSYPSSDPTVPLPANRIDYSINDIEKIGDVGVVKVTNNTPDTTFMRTATTLTGYGTSTVVRYFIDKDKLKEKFGNDDIVSYEFFSTLFVTNETGVEEFKSVPRDEDIDLKRGDTIDILFDGRRDLISLSTMDYRGSVIQIGDDQFKISIRTTADKAKSTGGLGDTYMRKITVSVPFDIKIKKDTPVTIFSRKTKLQEVSPGMAVTFNYSAQDDSGSTVTKNKTYRFERPLVDGYTRNEKGEVYKGETKINNPNDSLFIDNKLPLMVSRQENFGGGILTRTADAPDIDETFTDSESLTGRSKYDRVNVYLYDADKEKVDTAKKLGSITASDKKIQMNVNGDDVQGFEWTSASNDESHQIDKLYWAKKDIPLYFTNQDVLSNALENETPVVEQVQAKVNFDLNGGTLPLEVKSYQGIDKEKLPGTEFAYVVKRSQETENVIRIAPMNEKFANEEGYTPNGFEGNGVTYKEHNGQDLEGDALELRKFIAEEPKKANTQFLGWTTKKLEGTPEEVKKSFDELEEATTADQVNGGENYKFIKTSPITKETTVYAAYGLIESAVYNPEQKYDEATDKQYIEAKPAEDGKETPAATQKLVKKTGEDAEGNPTYEEIDVPVINIGGKNVFDITGEDSPVKDGDEIYIKTEEDGKPASYSTTPVVVDKKAPTLTSSDDDIVQDAYGYQAKVAASAEDTSGILRVYIDEDKENGYSNPEANEEQASLDAQLLKQRNQAKEYKITAIDKFGNKTVLENTLEVKQERVDLYLDNAYDGDDYVIAKSEAGASIEVKVDGKVVKTEQASGDYQEIILDSELAADQTIELTATIDGKQSRTIVIKVRN